MQQAVTEQQAYKIEMKEAENNWHKLSMKALCYLLYQFPEEFSEAIHEMHFPKNQGFESEEEWHRGDIFQRSLIADTLVDCNDWMDGQLYPLIRHEIDYLTKMRRKDGVGGWGYFPNLKELAPDVDDLGQMIQLYARLKKHRELEQYCSPLIELIISENKHTNGGFETWIIPAANRSRIQELQAEWAREGWGTGIDTEVVSNFIYGLLLTENPVYNDVVDKGIDYLIDRREKDGSWSSTWYFGNYYGTYTALRACLSKKTDSNWLARTEQYLIEGQKPSGGWGRTALADPLQTSFALLSLGLISAHKEEPIETSILTQALVFLQKTQMPSGCWTSVPFIKMELGRPRGSIHRVMEYGSKTITTNFVAKAANSISRLPQIKN